MRTATLLMTFFLLLSPAAAMAQSPCSPLVLSSTVIHEETLGFDVDIEYPTLCCPQANQIVRDWVSSLITDFKSLDPDHDLTDFPHKYELYVRYAVWPAHGPLASVKLDISVYTGGAHGNHWPMTWVFDVGSDRCVLIGEVFDNLDAALPEIARLVREPLSRSLGEMYVPDMLEQGIEPKKENFSRFVLTDEGVAFFFAPYQVGPFAAGEQVVTIPYSNLDHLLTPAVKDTLNMSDPVADNPISR